MFKTLVPCILLITAALLVPTTRSMGEDTAGTWESVNRNGQRRLTYSSSATLLGQATPFTVLFQCDPLSTKDVHGTLGFDITLRNVSKLKSFPFADFEGPDATVAPAVEAAVTGKGKSIRTFRTQAGGWYSDESSYCFGVSELSETSRSIPKSILQALGEGGAESLRLTISDPRNAKLKLEILIPVAGKQKDFKALLAGLK